MRAIARRIAVLVFSVVLFSDVDADAGTNNYIVPTAGHITAWIRNLFSIDQVHRMLNIKHWDEYTPLEIIITR